MMLVQGVGREGERGRGGEGVDDEEKQHGVDESQSQSPYLKACLASAVSRVKAFKKLF